MPFGKIPHTIGYYIQDKPIDIIDGMRIIRPVGNNTPKESMAISDT